MTNEVRRVHRLKEGAWTLVGVVAVVFVGAHLLDWFSDLTGFDKVLHAFTAFVLALLIAAYAYGSIFYGMQGHLLWRIVFVASCAISIGVLWEAGEWIWDQVFGSNALRSKSDIVWDLVADALGALLGATAGAWAARAGGAGSSTASAPAGRRREISGAAGSAGSPPVDELDPV